MAAIVELDYESNNPRIRLLNPFGVYPEVDRFGRTVSLTQVTNIDTESLAAQYPEFAQQILARENYQPGSPYITMYLKPMKLDTEWHKNYWLGL